MPTYTVTSLEGCLDSAKRAKIAAAITRVHSEATGAPTYFAQVIFVEVKPEMYFVGGVPLHGQQIFVNGQIRAGRTQDSKDRLIREMLRQIAEASQLPANTIWIYVTELVPRQMVEFGNVLPEPGDEEKWTAALPDADRIHMQGFGTTR